MTVQVSKSVRQMKQVIQARIAQLVTYQLGTVEVPGSNPGKGESFSVKISIGLFEFECEFNSSQGKA